MLCVSELGIMCVGELAIMCVSELGMILCISESKSLNYFNTIILSHKASDVILVSSNIILVSHP